MALAPRTIREEGHKRKFLVVIDGTEECGRALFYAAKRAERTDGALTLLFVITPSDFQHWINVDAIIREEAHEDARDMLERAAAQARGYAPGIEPELVIREGDPAEEIVGLIEDDADIAILVLAASASAKGPGPLVTTMTGSAAGTFPIPVTIVPGDLSDAELDLLS